MDDDDVPLTRGRNETNEAELRKDVQDLSHAQLVQMCLLSLSLAVQKHAADVPPTWEETAATYFEATLQREEAVGLVQFFAQAQKEAVVSVVNRFCSTEAALLSGLQEMERGIARTGALVEDDWQDHVKMLARLGSLPPAKMASPPHEPPPRSRLFWPMSSLGSPLLARGKRHTSAWLVMPESL